MSDNSNDSESYCMLHNFITTKDQLVCRDGEHSGSRQDTRHLWMRFWSWLSDAYRPDHVRKQVDLHAYRKAEGQNC